jgi:hypothetical protein
MPPQRPVLPSPVLPKVLSRLLVQIVPALAISALGGLLLQHSPQADNASRLQREQRALMADHLRRETEARRLAMLSAEQDMAAIKAVTPTPGATTASAEGEPTAAPSPMPAAARSERRPATRPSSPHSSKPVAVAPASQTDTPLPPPLELAPPPPAPSADSMAARLRAVAAMVARMPSFIPSPGDWFADDGIPPRPPRPLPERNFVNASL